jgi:small redox-active disulfide protein 2
LIIKVLGSGCKKCETVEERVKEAICEVNITAEVQKVTDFGEIAGYGVTKTPAVVIDEKVVISGRVPEISELKELLK